MNYGIRKEINTTFDATIIRTKEELKKEGFGILTDINVRTTLKKKLNVDFDDYVILGACNPPFAHKALLSEPEIGLLLPCNVIIYKNKDKVIVSAIKPTVAMNIIDNPNIKNIAKEIERKLKKVIDSI